MASIWSSLNPSISFSQDLAQLQALRELSLSFDKLAWPSQIPVAKLAEMRASLISMCSNFVAGRSNDQKMLSVSPESRSVPFTY